MTYSYSKNDNQNSNTEKLLVFKDNVLQEVSTQEAYSSDSIIYRTNRENSPTFLKQEDVNLLDTFEIESTFNLISDKVELHILSPDQQLRYSDHNFNQYGVNRYKFEQEEKISSLTFYPEKDAILNGFGTGDSVIVYNILRDKFNSREEDKVFFIEEISPDRTEIKAYSVNISEDELVKEVESIQSNLQQLEYLEKYKLNFQENRLFTLVNISTFLEDGKNYLIVKLYEPIPVDILSKDTFNVCEEIADTVSYSISVEFINQPTTFPSLKGPNFNIQVDRESSNPSEYFDKQTLDLQVEEENYKSISLYNKKDIVINVDYSDFSNFVHFSSAEERLRNFRYKLSKIQQYELEKSNLTLSGSLSTISARLTRLDNLIEEIVSNFDHYDRFLFFQSGSLSWPKTNNNYPYVNQSISDSTSVQFFNNRITESQIFDEDNIHRLINTVPEYIRDNEDNAPFILFIDMVGEYFDNVWLLIDGLSQKYNSDNRLEYGISRELVSEMLTNFGIKLYDSDRSFDNLLNTFTGTNLTGSEEQTQYFVSASNIPTPVDDYQKQIYKRLYHNLPLLTKAKGTEKGLRSLINIFGIPENNLLIQLNNGLNSSKLPFYGPETLFSSSLSRIRLDNTGSLVDQGSTLSKFISIIKDPELYTEDLHIVQVGFSPTDFVNNYLISGGFIESSFNIDEYIGDPRLSREDSYKLLENKRSEILSSGSVERYNLVDLFRTIRFYDNTLFKMVKDFVPARTKTLTGIVIKPGLLEKSKIKQPQAKWSKQDNIRNNSQLDYTSSYFSNFEITSLIEVAELSGDNAGGFKSGSLQGSYESFTFTNGGYNTAFTDKTILPQGGYGSKLYRDEAKITGEFGRQFYGNSIYYRPSFLKVADTDVSSRNIFKRVKATKIDTCFLQGIIICESSPTPTPTSTPPAVSSTPTPTPTSTPPAVSSTPTPTPSTSSIPGTSPTPTPTPSPIDCELEINAAAPSPTPTPTSTPPAPSASSPSTPTPTPSPIDCELEINAIAPSPTPTPTPTSSPPSPSITPTPSETPIVGEGE
jgi:hypothetical protein